MSDQPESDEDLLKRALAWWPITVPLADYRRLLTIVETAIKPREVTDDMAERFINAWYSVKNWRDDETPDDPSIKAANDHLAAEAKNALAAALNPKKEGE